MMSKPAYFVGAIHLSSFKISKYWVTPPTEITLFVSWSATKFIMSTDQWLEVYSLVYGRVNTQQSSGLQTIRQNVPTPPPPMRPIDGVIYVKPPPPPTPTGPSKSFKDRLLVALPTNWSSLLCSTLLWSSIVGYIGYRVWTRLRHGVYVYK